MKNKEIITELGKNTAIYGVGNILIKLAAFVLIPVYTRYLSHKEVGILALVEMFEVMLTPFFIMGLGPALFRHLAGKSKENKKIVVSTVFCCLFFHKNVSQKCSHASFLFFDFSLK